MLKNKPVLVKGTRILGPYESDTLREGIPKSYLQTIYDVCLWTGMRYIEVQRFWEHQEWWQPGRRAIFLPEMAQRKAKRKQKERYIHPVPHQLENVIRYFHDNPKPPSQNAWNENLKRWAENSRLDPIGITSKSTRKTIESWMISAEMPLHVVCLRQGHDSLTSMRHYQGLPFTEIEKAEISRRLAGIL